MAVTISGTDGIVGAGFTVDASGVSVTAGVGTFSSVQGSGANLTALPAANLTGTLPALNAASLTSIPAANIVGVCTSGFTKTGGFGGITQADQWRVTSEFTFSTSSQIISSNWERVDTDNFAYIGDGMSQSSGTFTFPETGIYLISYFGTGRRNSGNDRFGQIDLFITTDNFSSVDTQAGSFYVCAPSQYNRTTGNLQFIFDVENVSTHKCRFQQYENHGSLIFQGNTSTNYNAATFIRIGDT